MRNASLLLYLTTLWALVWSQRSTVQPADYGEKYLVNIQNPSHDVMDYLDTRGVEVADEDSKGILIVSDAATERDLRAKFQDVGARKINKSVQQLLKQEILRLNSPENLRFSQEIHSGMRISHQRWFSDYRTYDEIKVFLKQLEKDYPDVVRVESIGSTTYGENILMIRIGSDETPRQWPKRKILLQCQIHAREWISSPTCQFIAAELVADLRRGNKRIAGLLRDFELLVIPVLNVDGYRWSWTHDRFWRKNRRDNALNVSKTPLGFGVDLNRNFPDGYWGQLTRNKPPTSQSYPGVRSGSEPETQAIQSLFLRERYIVAALDFHSPTQKIIYTSPLPHHRRNVQVGARRMSQVVFSLFGRHIPQEERSDVGNPGGYAARFFHRSSLKDPVGRWYRPYSTLVELPKVHEDQLMKFVLPPNMIIPNGIEWINAITVYAEFVRDHPLFL